MGEDATLYDRFFARATPNDLTWTLTDASGRELHGSWAEHPFELPPAAELSLTEEHFEGDGIAFAFQDGDEPSRGKWLIGTKPKSVPVPPTAARLWRISAEPIDGTTDQLIASPVTGLFIIVQ